MTFAGDLDLQTTWQLARFLALTIKHMSSHSNIIDTPSEYRIIDVLQISLIFELVAMETGLLPKNWIQVRIDNNCS